MADITDETIRRVSELVGRYAEKCGHTMLEVTDALLASKTLRRQGYTQDQRGILTEEQGHAAIAVLEYWIGATVEHKQGDSFRQSHKRPGVQADAKRNTDY